MGNTISSDIRMKEDVPSDNKDGKLPILDTKMWVETDEDGTEQIRYELYEKPMVSRIMTMKRSRTCKYQDYRAVTRGSTMEKEHLERRGKEYRGRKNVQVDG